MKKRTFIFVLICSFLISTAIVYANGIQYKNGLQIININACYSIAINDLDALEDTADYIVQAKILPESINHDGYTETRIEITKVFHGPKEFKEGEILTIREPYYYAMKENEYRQIVNTLMAVNGYRPSETAREYIFFLEYFNDSYVPVLAGIGRYPLPENTIAAKSAMNTEVITNDTLNLAEDEVYSTKIYRNIYQEVIGKYFK